MAYANYFVVLGQVDGDVVVSDGSSSYKVNYSFDCYSSSFREGDTIYIDSYFSPSYGDKIIVDSLYGDDVCEVVSSETLDLKLFKVVEVLDSSDNVILEDKYGTQYLVEYGIGCLSMWRYANKTIHVDVGGSFLDGISDDLYLFDSEDDCRVWDAEQLDSSRGSFSGGSGYSYTAPVSASTACPANSSSANGKCTCNTGYVANGAVCITETQGCQNKYGANSYGTPGYCHCSSGYQFNEAKTSCVPSPKPAAAPPLAADPIAMCMQQLGPQGIVTGQNTCGCLSGYELNAQKNYCVLKPPSAPPAAAPVAAISPETSPRESSSSNFDVPSQEIERLNERGVIISAAAFRECPSTKCKIIRYYAEFSQVSITGKYKKENWYRIAGTTDAGGAGQQVVGWIYGSLVKQENNVDESAQMGGTTSAGVNREPPQQPSEGVVTRIWRAIRSWFGN